MIHKLFTIFTAITASAAFCYGLEEVTSANGGDRLKSFLEKFEKSDQNRDGVLTVDEMHDFLKKKIKDGAQSDPNPTKTVNLRKLKGLKSRSYLNAFFIETEGGADTDNDGILTKAELLDFVLSQRKVITEKGEQVPAASVSAAAQ